jgi:hypothetical protein
MIGKSALGIAFDAGNILVPQPAIGITALRTAACELFPVFSAISNNLSVENQTEEAKWEFQLRNRKYSR